MRQSRRVGADDHLGLRRIDRELRQRLVEHVIGGRARPGVARAQQPGQRLTGGVEVGDERVEPEPLLVGGRRALLLRVRPDEGAIDVDHVEAGISARRPRLGPSLRPSDLDPFEHRIIDRFQHPPRRGVRRHLAEQLGLVPQHRQIGDRLPTIGDHYGQIDQRCEHA